MQAYTRRMRLLTLDVNTAGRTLYAKVAALIPKYREKSKGTQGKGSSSGKSTGSKKKRKGKR